MEQYWPLGVQVNSLVGQWKEVYREEASKNNVEAMVTYALLLLQPTADAPGNPSDAVRWLQKCSTSSPEAAHTLGVMYSKGKYIPADLDKSYFYFKLSTLFRCRCGKYRNEYHSNLISNVHPCYPFLSKEALKKLKLSPERRRLCEKKFNAWQARNLR